MKVTGYLFVSAAGNLRVLKSDKGARANELVVRLELTIPDHFFRRPVPVVKIEIPKEMIVDPSVETVVAITAETVAGALKVDAARVRDGLSRMIEEEGGER